MYWFSRPAYGRWALAVLIVAVAAYMDVTGPATEAYPFVAEDVAEGESPEIEWRDVPVGLLPPSGDPTGRALAPLAAGTPLLGAVVLQSHIAPADWWAVSVELPDGAVAGGAALLSIPSQVVPGVVVAVGPSDTFGGRGEGLVAVAPEHAEAVAAAASARSVTVLIRP